MVEGTIRGTAPFLKHQLTGFAQWIKLKRKSIAGEKVDSAKLARIEKELVEQAEENFTASGRKKHRKISR